MHLTRFIVNRQRRAARELLGSAHKMHGAVMAGFSALDDYRPGDGPRILWRLDVDGPRPVLYIVSPARPDLTHLVEQAGWPTQATWDTADYDGLLDRLKAGQRWNFRLSANPTHSVRVPVSDGEKPGRGQRIGHVTAAFQEAWLLNRAERTGIVIGTEAEATFRVTRRDIVSFRRGSGTVTLQTAQYDGTLEVSDAGRLRTALVCGIGPAKGYGCGLLTLAPL